MVRSICEYPIDVIRIKTCIIKSSTGRAKGQIQAGSFGRLSDTSFTNANNTITILS